MNELKTHGKKTGHWVWYVFPTNMAGACDIAGTRVTKQTAPHLCAHEATARPWQAVLEKICDLLEANGMRIMPRIDHGRIHWFLKFWKDVPDSPDWMKDVVNRLDKFDWPPS